MRLLYSSNKDKFMKRWWFVALVMIGFVTAFFPLKGNNIRITGEPVLSLNSKADSVDIGFRLSWENSWRDEFNWDAAWLFVKYKKENAVTAWEHLNVGSVVVPSDLTYDFGKSGGANSGVFVYRSSKGGGAISDKDIHIRVGLNQFSGVTADEIRNKKVYVAVSGIEMVYIPNGAYYLGDGKSNRSFSSVQQRIMRPEDDIIGTDPSFTYSCIPTHYKSAVPAGAADRYNNAVWVDNSNYMCHISVANHSASVASQNISWTVNFKAAKTIRTFGISVANYSDVHGNYMPSKEWYLLASNDSLTWDTICRCAANEVNRSATSYPVGRSIRVQRPGSYQYYRLFFLEMNNGRNGFMLANVAMSEKDLYPDATNGYLVGSEKIVMGKGLNQLYADDGNTWTDGGVFPDAYPKGYRGFYCMKYELSQEQYVSFLNMLSRTQQAAHIGNVLDELKKGDYVFGDKSRPNARNGICVFSNVAGRPALFANNLNPSEPYYGEDDGQTIACNYLTPADLLAYCDWSGLRPMSEMEYEKVCRRPYPQYSQEEEYAWNSRELVSLTRLSDLASAGTENETAVGKNANAGNKIGPVRCGGFGLTTGSQSKAGAAFWGVMEMSGNLAELCYNAGNSGRAFNAADPAASHGNGVLSSNGLTDMTLWPAATTSAAFCLRGGSFCSTDSYLRVSDRSVLSVSGDRDSTVGFRGVRTFASGRESVVGGAIVCENGLVTDTACPGTPLRILSKTAGSVSGMDLPVSYIWYINDQVIPGEVGAELSYYFSNAGTTIAEYTIKRKVVSAVGEAMATQEVKVKVPNLTLKLNRSEINIGYDNIAESVVVSPVLTGIVFNYTWIYGGKIIGEGTEYCPSRDNFDGTSGVMDVYCETSVWACKAVTALKVNVSNERLVASEAVTMENCGKVLIIDKRDQKRYTTVKISDAAGENTQCWLAQNMNVGERVPDSDYTTHTRAGIQKICYENNEKNCNRFGGLYRWEEAMYGEKADGTKKMNGDYVQGICPDGWHVPSDAEWSLLEANLGLTPAQVASKGTWNRGGNAGMYMKKDITINGERFCSGVDCNKSGFNGMPTGRRAASNGGFELGPGSGNTHDSFWLADESGSEGMTRHLSTPSSTLWAGYGHGKSYGFSVRCIKN